MKEGQWLLVRGTEDRCSSEVRENRMSDESLVERLYIKDEGCLGELPQWSQTGEVYERPCGVLVRMLGNLRFLRSWFKSAQNGSMCQTMGEGTLEN
jgi:hypothetical protein